MAKRPVRSKAADFASSPTTRGRGITTPEISRLRASLGTASTGTSESPTSRSRTPPTSPSSKSRTAASSRSSEARVEIKIWLPGAEITIRGYLDELELNRDFKDMTSWYDANRVYLVGGQTFTLKGRQAAWEKPR